MRDRKMLAFKNAADRRARPSARAGTSRTLGGSDVVPFRQAGIAFLSLSLMLWPVLVPVCLAAESQSVVLIEGGTLIDGTGAPPAPGSAILIEGGRIRQVGRQGAVHGPSGTRVIQADGKYIIPSLIDSHVHYDMPWLHRLYLANGVTTVRDLGSPLDRIVTLRQEIAEGNILAPRMYISGTPINPAAIKAMCLGSAKEMAKKLVQAGVDGIKVTGYTPEELREIAQVAHANGLIVYGHTGPKKDNRGPGARLAIEAGLDGVEHALGVLEDSMDKDPPVPVDFDAGRRGDLFRYWYGRMHSEVNIGKMDALIRLMVQRHTYFAPTLVNFDRNFVKRNTPELESDPALKYIPEDKPDAFGRFGAEDREEWRKTLNLMKEATAKFQKEGGLLIVGTDSPGAAFPGWSVHQEMELFVQAGIAPMRALQAATLNNAKVLNREKDLGTVEAGKYGDLLILDANPLTDIRNTQKIHLVLKNGKVLEPAVLLEENLRQFGARGERRFDRSRKN